MRDAITFAEEGIIERRDQVRRDATRWVFSAGDFIEPLHKIQLKSLGVRSGGLRLGHSDTEGCPSMWRTNYVIRRGLFTPLETTATTVRATDAPPKAGDMPRYIDNSVSIRGAAAQPVRSIYPADDLATLTSDSYREMGIVEIPVLAGVEWDAGVAQTLNKRFFPELDRWLSGEADFPTKLADYEDLIKALNPESETEMVAQEQMLESARQFRSYALNVIEYNRSRIEATRSIDMGGYSFHWSNRAKLFADQLGIALENERDIINTVKIEQPQGNDEIRNMELEVLSRLADALSKGEVKPNEIKVGDLVMVGGEEGKVVRKPFGKVQVELTNGETKTVEKSEINA